MAAQDSADSITPARNEVEDVSSLKDSSDDTEKGEVFKQTKDGVNFRTLGWKWASVIFLKRMCRLAGYIPREDRVITNVSPTRQSPSQPEF